ncbi:unnamed protein product, partial [marine sediment metagenome]
MHMRLIPVLMVLFCLMLAAALALSAEATGDGKDSDAKGASAAPEDESTNGDKTDESAKKEDGGESASKESTPTNPFGKPAARRSDAVPGAIELSDGTLLPGLVYLTRSKDVEIFDTSKKKQRRIPLAGILTIETIVEWERMDPEWRFKTAGDPEKVYTGKS